MTDQKSSEGQTEISRDRLAELLNEDLSREYQAIISYVVYSQVLTGAQYMDIAAQLEVHAKQELDHALIISRQIDYLGKMPAVTPKPVRTSKDPKQMLRYDLDNENETIRNYRDRIRQCERLGEYAMAEQIRQILMQEQDHQIDLATALGIEAPDVSGPKGRSLQASHCLTQETESNPTACRGPSATGETSAGSACRGNRAMTKTYRDVAVEQMILTVKEAMSRTIEWWGELPAPMNEAIDSFRVQLAAAIDSVDFLKRALDRPAPDRQ
jgi:bacterioferritin